MKWLLAAIAVAATALLVAQGLQSPRRISLVVTGRFVITENDARQTLSPGSVAIDGDSIVAVDRPGGIARRFTAPDTTSHAHDIALPGPI